jgi:hypothetical protein
MTQHDANRLAAAYLRQLYRGTAGIPAPLAVRLLATLAQSTAALRAGVSDLMPGPWTVGTTHRRLRGLSGAVSMPTVERPGFAIPIADPALAAEVAALFNWCRMAVPSAA